MKTLIGFICIMVAFLGYAQNSTIHNLPLKASPSDTDYILLDDGSFNWKSTVGSLHGSSTNYLQNLYITSNYVTYLTVESNVTVNGKTTINNDITVVSNAYFNYNISTNLTVYSNAFFYANTYIDNSIITNLTVINGFTNLDLSPNQYVASDANGKVISTLEGSGWTNQVGATNLYQFVTLNQLQQYALGTEVYYFNTRSNNATGVTLSVAANSTNWAYTDLPGQWTNAAATSADGTYVAAFATADTFTSLSSGVGEVELWCFEESAGAGSVTAEFYIYNTVTDEIIYEFMPAPAYQVVPASSEPQKLSFSVPITDFQTNDAFRLVVQIKVQAGAPDPTIRIVSGGAYASHMSFSQPGASYVRKSGDTMTGNLTAPAFRTPTNAWSGPTGNVDLAVSDQYYAAGADMELSGVINKSTTQRQSVLLMIVASGADRTLYIDGGITLAGGASTMICTNGVPAYLSLTYTPVFGGLTNAVARDDFFR